MKSLKKIEVLIDGNTVGTLAMMKDGRAAFQYTTQWLKNGFPISPFGLPLTNEVFIPKNHDCHGLFGIFEDSLPDAWGTLLMNRRLGELGADLRKINVLDRLSLVGNSGAGDLEYRPAMESDNLILPDRSLDDIQESCEQLLILGDTNHLDELFYRGGSSGGARPKIYAQYENAEWIIKFPTQSDGADAGKMEYEYSKAARQCGITMSETHLFYSDKCPGYFGTRRFDRADGQKLHTETVKAILNLPFDTPNLDYLSLLQLTDVLTNHDRDSIRQMFLRTCFNVFAHNQDDHSKNFSFLYNKSRNCWELAPAYDLTYSTTAYNQHTTSVNWNGNPDKNDLLEIVHDFNISKSEALDLADMVYHNTQKLL